MEQRLSLITLGVKDLGRSRAFYEALGWRPDDVGEDIAFFQAGGMVIAIWDRAKLAEDSAVADPGGWGGITLRPGRWPRMGRSACDGRTRRCRATKSIRPRAPQTDFTRSFTRRGPMLTPSPFRPRRGTRVDHLRPTSP